MGNDPKDSNADGLAALRERAAPRHVALLNRLRFSENHRKVIGWPGVPELKVQLVALSCTEIQDATAAAWHRFKDLGLDIVPILAEEWSAEEVTQKLYRAVRQVDDHQERLFASADELRDLTSEPARFEVWQDLDVLEKSVASNFDVVSRETLYAIDEAIKKKDVDLLKSFGRHTLAGYLLITDEQRSTSQTDKSTSGQDSSESSSKTSEQTVSSEPSEPPELTEP